MEILYLLLIMILGLAFFLALFRFFGRAGILVSVPVLFLAADVASSPNVTPAFLGGTYAFSLSSGIYMVAIFAIFVGIVYYERKLAIEASLIAIAAKVLIYLITIILQVARGVSPTMVEFRFFAGSLLGFIVSASFVIAFSYLMKKGFVNILLNVLISLLAVAFLDSIVYSSIAIGGTSQYLVEMGISAITKACIAILFVPGILLVSVVHKEEAGKPS